MHKDVKKKREEKEKRPDTHDVNDNRSSFDALLFFYFLLFLGILEKEKERGLKERSWDLRDIQSDTVYYTLWNVICKTAREILLAQQQFGKEKRTLENKKQKHEERIELQTTRKYIRLRMHSRTHTHTKWPFRI